MSAYALAWVSLGNAAARLDIAVGTAVQPDRG